MCMARLCLVRAPMKLIELFLSSVESLKPACHRCSREKEGTQKFKKKKVEKAAHPEERGYRQGLSHNTQEERSKVCPL